jgi:hypothetical protein
MGARDEPSRAAGHDQCVHAPSRMRTQAACCSLHARRARAVGRVGGEIARFPSAFASIDQLREVVSTIIWLASGQVCRRRRCCRCPQPTRPPLTAHRTFPARVAELRPVHLLWVCNCTGSGRRALTARPRRADAFVPNRPLSLGRPIITDFVRGRPARESGTRAGPEPSWKAYTRVRAQRKRSEADFMDFLLPDQAHNPVSLRAR